MMSSCMCDHCRRRRSDLGEHAACEAELAKLRAEVERLRDALASAHLDAAVALEDVRVVATEEERAAVAAWLEGAAAEANTRTLKAAKDRELPRDHVAYCAGERAALTHHAEYIRAGRHRPPSSSTAGGSNASRTSKGSDP